jgi:hypothetical protein
MTELATRTTQEVFDDHLRLRRQGETEQDMERNYADNVVVLSGSGINHGPDGIRTTATILAKDMPGGSWEYRVRLVEGDYAFLQWTGRTVRARKVCDGADSFVIRDGRIAFQSIHYTVHGDNRS